MIIVESLCVCVSGVILKSGLDRVVFVWWIVVCIFVLYRDHHLSLRSRVHGQWMVLCEG